MATRAIDLWGMDVTHFGNWATLRYTNAKVRENHSRRFSIRFPNEELPAARPQQTTPLYDPMKDQNHAVMGDKVGDKDYGAVVAPHGYGAGRFNAAGTETPKSDSQRDGDWRVVGWVSSGGYGHYVQASFAQAYIPAPLAELTGIGHFEVEILGKRMAARIQAEPLFDPGGARIRS